MSTKTSKENNQSKKSQCKTYTQSKGAYSSFKSGERCKRNAVENGYCRQHLPHSSQDLEGKKKSFHDPCPYGNEDCPKPLSKPVSEKKCEEKGYHTGYHTSQEPVSEGKGEPKYQCKSCRKFFPKAKIIEDVLYFHCQDCFTPPSNALRSEEELRKEWLEVGQMEFKMFAGYASMVADWWIAKLTSERQRAYFEGVQNGINECKPEFDLARADERKKMGELIKKFCESKSWKEDAGNEVVQLEDILDYLSKLVKPQDK